MHKFQYSKKLAEKAHGESLPLRFNPERTKSRGSRGAYELSVKVVTETHPSASSGPWPQAVGHPAILLKGLRNEPL